MNHDVAIICEVRFLLLGFMLIISLQIVLYVNPCQLRGRRSGYNCRMRIESADSRISSPLTCVITTAWLLSSSKWMLSKRLEECRRSVAAGVLIGRAAQRCLLWQIDGLAGVAAQLSYISLLQSLAELLTPVHQGNIKNIEFIDLQYQQKQHQTSVSRSYTRAGASFSAAQNRSSSSSSLLHMSLLWAQEAYTDLVHSLLTLRCWLLF